MTAVRTISLLAVVAGLIFSLAAALQGAAQPLRADKILIEKSLRVSYPNAEDVANARRLRCSPGGDIMIHGLPNGRGAIGPAHVLVDWTLGCIAVTNAEIEEVWKAVPNGTAVEIRP